MRELRIGFSHRNSPYADRGCLDQDTLQPLGPAAEAAQRRDGYVCQYCGFWSPKYQRCVGPATEIADDLITVCIFCEQVLRIDLVPQMRSGVLIRLPEMTQAALNRAMPQIYAHRPGQTAESKRARELLDRLNARRDDAKSEFGWDNPAALVEHLGKSDSPLEEAEQLMQKGLRVMPLDRRILVQANLEFNHFIQILAYWRSSQGPLWQASRRGLDSGELDRLAL